MQTYKHLHEAYVACLEDCASGIAHFRG